MILQKNKIESQFLNRFKKILKLSAVRKVSETITFQTLGIIETVGSIISHGTSKKFADVRTHLRKVFKMILSSIWDEKGMSDQALIIQSIWMTFSVSYEITSLGIDTKEIGSIWFEEVVIAITVNDIDTL